MLCLRPILLLFLLASLLVTSGCSLFPDKEDVPTNWTAARLYDEATAAYNKKSYDAAIEHFQELEKRFPFGPFAQRAQLNIGFAYLDNEELEAALSAANRFIRLNPRHEKVDRAYYLRGLATFDDRSGKFGPIRFFDPATRDPRTLTESFRYFSQLVNKFPASQYSSDARQRMVYLRNTLAKHELHVARFYVKRGAFIAAINRAKYIIEKLPESPATADALAILIRTYKHLGMHYLANNSLQVLQLNYPDHPQAKALRKRTKS
ncbi:MAG: outer membrane protein assembly factor BamD [Gammaproteobacteria bacterium]|nr:outer membrane protein assembly factor BamD [Gammaproteobacteria bacterium]